MMARPPTSDLPFRNIYAHGLVRVAACAPRVHLADPAANAAETVALARRAQEAGAAVLLCPELGLTGYSLDDLHLQRALLDAAEEAIEAVVRESQTLTPVLAVGAPVLINDAVFNCAIVIHRGRILGVIPKSYLPNYREFYEKRLFAAARDATTTAIRLANQEAPFGADLIFAAEDLPGFILAIEICEDLWAPVPPSAYAALAGATVLANLSASNISIGKADLRAQLCRAHSDRCMAAYMYAAAGRGESTTDLAWDGHLGVYELGGTLAENARFAEGSDLLLADVDVERLVLERARTPTFRDGGADHAAQVRSMRRIGFTLAPPPGADVALIRPVPRFPFVPDDPARLNQDCFEAVSIQVQGVRTRLEAAGARKAMIGVSGGLDSTQALLVAVQAFDQMGRPRGDIVAVTMPGFATSEATKANAWALMRGLGVDAREVDIRPLARQMLSDLGHPFARGEPVYDVTFENVQAGLRTDYLFRLANHEGGLVIGTGDLSELALGWATYGVGDHMSHYAVNASAPKTLIQHLIRWTAADGRVAPEVAATLHAILATEISPELVPADAQGAIQSTQATIGPYALHDFFLFYATRYGLAPTKIAFLAAHAWEDASRGAWPANLSPGERRSFDLPEIVRWLEVFVARFYATTQFKRSCIPNGPKLSSGGSLSPRGDWRAPSDSSAAPWLSDIERLKTWIA